MDPLLMTRPPLGSGEAEPGHTVVTTAQGNSFSVQCMALPEPVTEFLLKECDASKSQDLGLEAVWVAKLQAVLDTCRDPAFPDGWASCVRQRGSMAAPANLLWSAAPLDADWLTAFHLAVLQGPLCHEPLQGVVWVVSTETPVAVTLVEASTAAAAGTCVSLFKQGFVTTFASLPMRLVLAIYRMLVRCQYQVLGAVYHLIHKRRGKVTNEQAEDGTPYFLVGFELPILHSFQFVRELGTATSGAAFVQVLGTGWERIPEDPLLDPKELTDEFNAKTYYLMLRKRKGLPVDTKLVEHGEKQRTLMRK